MPTADDDKKTGLYENAINRITQQVRPTLQKKTDEFIKKSVEEYAKDDPRYASIIEFEVKRRGEGAGLTQDVAEPLLWTGVKTASGLGVAAVSESLKDNKLKMVGRFTALGIVLNNVVDLFRLVPRYVAGLQGSLEMAKERQRSIKEIGIDPFDNGSLHDKPLPPVYEKTDGGWVKMEQKRDSEIALEKDQFTRG